MFGESLPLGLGYANNREDQLGTDPCCLLLHICSRRASCAEISQT